MAVNVTTPHLGFAQHADNLFWGVAFTAHFVHLSRGQNTPNSLNKSGPLLGGHSSSVIQTRVSATVYLSSNSKRSPCQSVLNRKIFAVSCRSLAILNNVALARSLEVTVPINLFPVMVKYPSGIASAGQRKWRRHFSSYQWFALISPSKGFCQGSVEIFDEGFDPRLELLGRAEVAATDDLADQDREPDLDLIEP